MRGGGNGLGENERERARFFKTHFSRFMTVWSVDNGHKYHDFAKYFQNPIIFISK